MSMTVRNNQFIAKLTPKQAAEGIRAAVENAASLLDDAKLLFQNFQNHRYERSFALAVLAIEEAGKPSIIRGILLEDDPRELRKLWKEYRRHTDKNSHWIILELVAKGARKLEDMCLIAERSIEHRQLLEDLKQLALYTDSFRDSKWSLPREVIDVNLAKLMLSIAGVLVPKDSSTTTTEKELELWAKHLKPVWRKEMWRMKDALVNCYSEAEAWGLVPQGMAAKMANFVS